MDVVLGHQSQIEKWQVLRVGVLHRNELREYVLSVGAESGIKRNCHKALEALEQNSISTVFGCASAVLGADSIVWGDQYLAIILHEVRTVSVFPQESQESQDGHLEEGILDSTDFVLGVEIADDLFVDARDLGH